MNRTTCGAKKAVGWCERRRKGKKNKGGRTEQHSTSAPPGGNHMLPGFMSTPTLLATHGKASPLSYPKPHFPPNNSYTALLLPRVFLPSRFPRTVSVFSLYVLVFAFFLPSHSLVSRGSTNAWSFVLPDYVGDTLRCLRRSFFWPSRSKGVLVTATT